MSEKFNLTEKQNWSLENTEIIAKELNFVSNQEFRTALSKFVDDNVIKAKVTDYLPIIARTYFDRYQPPLIRKVK